MDGAGAGAATGATNTGGAGIDVPTGKFLASWADTTTFIAFTTGAGAGATGAAGATLPDSNLAVRAWTAAVRASILDSRDIQRFLYVYRWLNYKTVLTERLDDFTNDIRRLTVLLCLSVKCFVIVRGKPHGQKLGFGFGCHKYFLIS
jgi:hypothetical protein